MTILRLIKQLSKTNAKIFLEKSYSLELLIILSSKEEMSIKETYQRIVSFKPEFNAFNIYINRLLETGLCTKVNHRNNNSKKVILLDEKVLVDLLDEKVLVDLLEEFNLNNAY